VTGPDRATLELNVEITAATALGARRRMIGIWHEEKQRRQRLLRVGVPTVLTRLVSAEPFAA
jgi:hypothetical protein